MTVVINLENDEALVLFELLASNKLDQAVDVPERRALHALESLLEKALTEPLRPGYDQVIEAARQSLLDRYGRDE